MVTQWSNQDTNSGLSNTNMYLKLELAYYFVAKKLKTIFWDCVFLYIML